MEKITLDKNRFYIIGVSGGPDSMALFDMCRKQQLHVVVAHMNYQLRDSAKRDMDIVKDYCKQYGITYEIRMQNKQCVGNFQAFARQERYAFYREVIKKYHASAVLLAHQLDDHLETYLMQKQSNRYASYFGIQYETEILGCAILRPLLSYTKEELQTYCIENHVSYGIDESNLSDHYERNRIRHNVIEHMTYVEKEELVRRIEEENKIWSTICTQADSFLSTWQQDIASLRTLDTMLLEQVLIHFIAKTCHIHLQRQEITLIRELILKKSNHWTRDLSTMYVIYSEYGKLCIDTKEDVTYTYVYTHVQYEKTPYFQVSSQGSGVEAVTLLDCDFPITIRAYEEHDEIQLRFGTKRVNRWFIDRKIPKKERRRWPVVVNAEGNVILVPKIGCDIAHFSNNPTCFVVK